ncbi:MAG TPA: glycerol-3-phosphate 1-O-acyltransferase PlsY [Candidatus Binatia bacterium]|jgi:glycerol-3-phosphate acyltransferase PlsY|nr:glycerol-3-phosphate 1-O-acyltransferase PlsY [Candidatus Binatia bacterium]
MELLLTISSYLLGSVPSGFIIGALSGVDVRNAGSGNIGATNVARLLGKRLGLLTLVADVAKGFVPVLLAEKLGMSDVGIALVAMAAFLGHLYPLFLRFQGGKGVATAFGALLGVAPPATLVLLVVFGIAVLFCRIVSLGSIAAALAAPFALWALDYSAVLVLMSAFLGGMIVLRHRENIKRLLDGTEPRFGSR